MLNLMLKSSLDRGTPKKNQSRKAIETRVNADVKFHLSCVPLPAFHRSETSTLSGLAVERGGRGCSTSITKFLSQQGSCVLNQLQISSSEHPPPPPPTRSSTHFQEHAGDQNLGNPSKQTRYKQSEHTLALQLTTSPCTEVSSKIRGTVLVTVPPSTVTTNVFIIKVS